MRCWSVVTLLLFGMGFPACAQHGGAAHAGFAGHSGGGIAGGSFAGSARSGFGTNSHPGGFGGTPSRSAGGQLRSASPGFQRPGFRIPGSRMPGYQTSGNRGQGYPSAGIAGNRPTATRPVFFNRSRTTSAPGYFGAGPYGNRGRDGRLRNNYLGVYPGFLGYGIPYPFWDDGLDSFWNDDNTLGYNAALPQDGTGVPYAGQAAFEGDPSGAGPYPPQGTAAPYVAGDAAPQRKNELPEEEAVTLIFKDGRPPEQIRNYALTRTALYVPGRHMREIPLEQLDLPATERVNHDAGITFQLP